MGSLIKNHHMQSITQMCYKSLFSSIPSEKHNGSPSQQRLLNPKGLCLTWLFKR
uniref:Uncharacterized protein n=1 Tax=Physcomitrium patens TaxID=3218 RepID=A0A2K1IEW5_PHYPA|nr:hypothetical protein PHYPA_029965 [Physcomitrium patens]